MRCRRQTLLLWLGMLQFLRLQASLPPKATAYRFEGLLHCSLLALAPHTLQLHLPL